MREIGAGIYAFDHAGIMVSIPAEMSNIIPRQMEIEWSPEMWRQDNFRPLRMVMNLKLVDLNNSEEAQLKFSSPIQIKVYYRWAEKVEAVKRAIRFSLAYWQDNQWNLIDEYSDEFPLLSHDWAGFLKFEVLTWGDPAIALGF